MTSRALLAFAVLLAMPARAQENYEIQVYASETMTARATIYELHSNHTFTGRRLFDNGVRPTHGQWHETVEITRGLNEWSELGVYFFTAAGAGQSLRYVGSHLRPRVRVPASWNWPVGLSLSTEFGWQSSEFAEDTWSMEIRPIIDKQMGDWYVSFNPVVEKSFRGYNSAEGFELAPALALNRDFSKLVNVGVEYYGGWGSTKSLATASEREHLVFGVVNLDIAPEWEFNAGMGFGLGASQEKRIFKLILGYRVGLPKLP
jgi:hypothetical protein